MAAYTVRNFVPYIIANGQKTGSKTRQQIEMSQTGNPPDTPDIITTWSRATIKYRTATGAPAYFTMYPKSDNVRFRWFKRGNTVYAFKFQAYYATSQFARISNIIDVTFILGGGDTLFVTIARMEVLYLNASSVVNHARFPNYMPSRILGLTLRQKANNVITIGWSASIPLTQVFLVIKEIAGLTDKVAQNFPITIHSTSGTANITGNLPAGNRVDVTFSREPNYLTQGTYVFRGTITREAGSAPAPPPMTPESPPPSTAEKVRIAVDAVRYNESDRKFECHVSFVPDSLSTGITKIQTYSSLISNPTSRQGSSYSERTTDDFYKIIIQDGETRNLYVRLEQRGKDDITTGTVIITRTGNLIELERPNIIVPLVKLINIFIIDAGHNQITFRIKDELFLTEQITKIRVSYPVTNGFTEIDKINDREKNYMYITIPNLAPTTSYKFKFYAEIGNKWEELTEITARTVMALSDPHTVEQAQKQTIAKIICQSLPDKEAMQLMLLPFNLQSEFVKDILAYRTMLDGLYFGSDQNPHNADYRYEKQTKATRFSPETDIVAKAIVSAELLIIPEPHEDVDLTKDAF